MSGLTSEMIVLLVIALVIAAICIIPTARKKPGSPTSETAGDADASPPGPAESRLPAKGGRKKG